MNNVTDRDMLSDINIPLLEISDYSVLVPMIGILDSTRTQKMMEGILQNIKQYSTKFIIIDIAGIVTIDSAVAAHIIKITKATRLMGAETIISGISPVIAQTIVNLGVSLENITTVSSLKEAIKLADDKISIKYSSKHTVA